MFKVSFKEGSKKVETFNNRATVVTLVGQMVMPSEVWTVFSDKVANWMWHHPSVDASWGACTKENEVIRLEFSGKSVCAEDDTFDTKIGERIAESRAKIKLFKFMYKLIDQLCNYYSKLLLGYKDFSPASFVQGSLYTARMKYRELWVKESHHLGKLLEEA